jgi:hypothetical protein
VLTQNQPPAPIDDKSFHRRRMVFATCAGHFRAHLLTQNQPPAPIDDKSFHRRRMVFATCAGHFRAHFCVVHVFSRHVTSIERDSGVAIGKSGCGVCSAAARH